MPFTYCLEASYEQWQEGGQKAEVSGGIEEGGDLVLPRFTPIFDECNGIFMYFPSRIGVKQLKEGRF